MPEWLRWLGGEFLEVDVLGRLLLAALLGAIIGVERERAQKAAGFRTNILICLGSALVMEVSRALAEATGAGTDPTRMPAQVISGIGFIGAGTILVARGRVVVGLTTAATIWVVAAIGIAVGAEAYTHAVVTTILMIVVLSLLGRIEDYLFIQMRTIQVELELTASPGALDRVRELLRKEGEVHVTDLQKHPERLRVTLEIRAAEENREQIFDRLTSHADVRRVTLPTARPGG